MGVYKGNFNLTGNCPLCGIWRNRLVIDHIIPRHKGGTHERSNLQFICANCHQDKTEVEMRERHKDRVFSPEHRAKISAANRGRKLSAETRARISVNTKRAMATPECRQKLKRGYAKRANGVDGHGSH